MRIIRLFSAALILAFLVSFLPMRRAYAGALTVNNLGDGAWVWWDGTCTLREAIDTANWGATTDCGNGAGADTITFSVSGAITLTAGQFWIGDNITINGGGTIIIDGNNGTRIFQVASAGSLTLHNLALQNGQVAGNGAAVENDGTLTVDNVTFSNNQVTGAWNGGGAIFNDGTATLSGATFQNNQSQAGNGGAIFNTTNGVLTVDNSIFDGNQVTAPFTVGGAIHNEGSLTVSGTTFQNNQCYRCFKCPDSQQRLSGQQRL